MADLPKDTVYLARNVVAQLSMPEQALMLDQSIIDAGYNLDAIGVMPAGAAGVWYLNRNRQRWSYDE